MCSSFFSLSTVEANWNLGNLGRGDTNKTLASECRIIIWNDFALSRLSDVFNFVANTTGYKNNGLNSKSELPLLNLTGNIPGPLNPDYFVPYLAPNTSATGGGDGPTFVANNINRTLNASDAPAPVNLTATSSAIGSYPQADFLVSAMGAVFAGALLL